MKPPGDAGAEGRYGWRLPGGTVRERELVTDAAARGLREETGIRRCPRRIVALDQVPGQPESLAVVLDGGLLTGTPADIVHVPENSAGPLPACMWVPAKRLRDHCRDYQERRILAAVQETGELGNDDPGLPMLVLGAHI
ncbi:NUDIX domain-containing protein [Streptomyces sp. NPDC050428]|uniref:NUDIX domain-containing protein n=1 Tax=Streptomyces sp. NPDC050428 TaxID=3155757 RepID=UPI003439246B